MKYNPDESPLVQLLQKGILHTLPKGQILQVSERHMLFIVQSGYVKRYQITSSGVKSVQSIYGPTNVFPLTPVYKQLFDLDIYRGTQIFYYEAMTPVTVCSIGKNELAAALDSNDLLFKDLLYVSGVRFDSTIQYLDNISLVSAHRRVAHQLAYFAEVFGESVEGATVIRLPLTHQDIANVLNMARETVSHVLLRLRDKGLLDPTHKNIVVTDLRKLKDEARQ